MVLYRAVADAGAETVTVSARANDDGAAVAYGPAADADAELADHQVAAPTGGDFLVAVAVTAADGTVRRYRVVVAPTAAGSNAAPTGLPTITGTPQVEETLTASTSDIDDEDGLTNVSYEYQWIAGGSDIDGATGSTYTLTYSEQGKTIQVRVTFTDDAENAESLTSGGTDAVAAKPNSEATGLPTITGTPQVDETLTASTSAINDEDGLEDVEFNYQWIANDGNGDTDIDDATDSTYTPSVSDVGKTIKVKVSFTDDAENEESLTSEATEAVAAKPNSEATGLPTITGTPQVDETLTASTSAINDEDGLDDVEFNYQWIANDGNGDTDIDDATDSTYTPSVTDAEKTIKVRVSFSDDAGNDEVLTSAATGAVAVVSPGPPVIGPHQWTDYRWDHREIWISWSPPIYDGGAAATGYDLRYIRDDASDKSDDNWTYENGLTGTSYTVDDLTNGVMYNIQVRAVNRAGSGAWSATFSETPRTLPPDAYDVSVTPGNQTLTVEWSEPPVGAQGGVAIANYVVVHIRTDVPDHEFTDLSYWTASDIIPTSGPLSYTITGLTNGGSYFVKVRSINALGDISYPSFRNFVLATPNSRATGLPTITGTPQVGQTLTADTSNIADEDGLNNVSYSYQWIRSDNGADTDIAGETDSTYTLVLADMGKTIKVQATFTDDADNQENLTSEATVAVAAAVPTAPLSLTVTPGDQSQELHASWQAPSSNGGSDVTGYKVQWKESTDSWDTETDVSDTTVTGTTHTITSLTGGVEYAVRVIATNVAGDGPASTEARATPADSPASGEEGTETGESDSSAAWTATLTVGVSGSGSETVWGYSWFLDGMGTLDGRTYSEGGQTIEVMAILLSNGYVAFNVRPHPSVDFVLTVDGTEFASADAGEVKSRTLISYVWATTLDWAEDDRVALSLTLKDTDSAEQSEPAENTPATGLPTISGTPQAGQTLTANTTGISDADGLDNVDYSYQWIGSNGNSDTDLQDATASAYTPSVSDVGKTIKVKVSFTDDANNDESLTSVATTAVAATVPTAPLSLTVATGDQIQELDASWQAPSSNGGAEITGYKVQWKAAADSWDTAAEVSVASETGTTHTITDLTGGVEHSVRVIASNTAGDGPASTEVKGTPAGAVSEQVVEPENSAPTGLPGISGTPQVDQTLTADTSPIDDADGLTNVSYRYQWIAGGSDIDGATGSTYTLTAREQGLSVLVRVSFTDDADNQETLTSAATVAVAARPNSPPTGAPTISGTAQSGETLTADVSGVGDADGLANVSYSYQWIRNDGNSDSDIPDATDTTYTLVSADEGKTIKVRVSFTDDADNQETLTSTTTVIVDQPGAVSLWPELPRIGTVVKATLTDPDGLEGAGSGAAASLGALSWQWSRSSEGSTWTSFDVGQDGNSYTPTGDDEGMWLKVTAVYTDGHGRGKSAEAITAATIGAREASPELTVTELATGLTHPWDIAFTPDGTMLFTERDDGLRVRLPDGTVRQVTADFSDLNFGGTAGLLALVLDPDFVSNRRFYTYQRHTGPEMQVIAWTIDQDYTAATRVADPLVGGIPVNPNRGPSHGGGRLRFGPQGYLWIATGDGFSGTAAQDLTSLGGKVLRVDSQTGAGAPGNPFAPSPVYTYGHRNPQGLALRPGTGQMWSVEHGPDHDDEINLLVSGGNYGWDPAPDEGVEGLYDETTTPMTDLVKFPDALQAKWSSGYPTLAVGGGVFLEGSKWREWEGQFAVATLKTKSVRVFKFTEEGDLVSQAVVPELDRTYGRLRTAVLGPDGALYITTTNGGGKDKILKVVPANTPATGAPTIGGTAQVGETLTVDTSAISDQDGLSGVSYSYQWIRNDGRSDTGLQDATASTYTPSVTDVGKAIKVRVSFKDDAENAESQTSEATAEVLATVPTEPLSLTVATGDQTQELDASWQAPSTNGGSAVTGYKVQWKEAADSWDTAADVSEATVPGTTHTITGLTGGVEYAVRVIATNDVGDGLASTEAKGTPAGGVSEQNAEPENTEPTGLPTIGGTPRVGEMLAADTSGIADEDGLDDVSYSYQWVAGDTDIDGATGSSYVLTSSEQGKTIKVKVSFTDDANNQETLTSAATVAIMPQADNAEPAAPIWSADMLVVEYTTVSIGAASADLFSNVGGSAGLHIKSLWSYTLDRDLRLAFEEAVPGAADLTLQVGDLSLEFPAGSSGKSSFKWTGVDVDWEDGQTIAVNIFPTSTMVEPTPNSPATGVPTISGTPQVGQSLTADTSPIADEDGLTNVSYRYQWIAAGTDIDGATGSTYVLTSSEQGQTIQVRVTFTDDRDNEETLTSAATVAVAAKPNTAANGLPTISGTPQAGQTLTADTANIVDQDGLTGVSYTYQWIAGGTDIDEATGSSYTLTASEHRPSRCG